MSDKSIEDMAEERGPRKPGARKDLTKSEIEERNGQLVRDRLRGQSWSFLGHKFDLTARRCQDIFTEWREQNQSTYAGREPIDLVYRMLDRYEAWVEQLAEVAADASADSVAIAAINAQMAAMQKAAELCQATGILPNNLGMLRLEMDVRVLAQQLMAVLSEHDASLELKRSLLKVLQPDALSVPALPNGSG